MQIAGAAGGAITTLMVLFYLNAWYGTYNSMVWVGWTGIFQVLKTTTSTTISPNTKVILL